MRARAVNFVNNKASSAATPAGGHSNPIVRFFWPYSDSVSPSQALGILAYTVTSLVVVLTASISADATSFWEKQPVHYLVRGRDEYDETWPAGIVGFLFAITGILGAHGFGWFYATYQSYDNIGGDGEFATRARKKLFNAYGRFAVANGFYFFIQFGIYLMINYFVGLSDLYHIFSIFALYAARASLRAYINANAGGGNAGGQGVRVFKFRSFRYLVFTVEALSTAPVVFALINWSARGSVPGFPENGEHTDAPTGVVVAVVFWIVAETAAIAFGILKVAFAVLESTRETVTDKALGAPGRNSPISGPNAVYLNYAVYFNFVVSMLGLAAFITAISLGEAGPDDVQNDTYVNSSHFVNDEPMGHHAWRALTIIYVAAGVHLFFYLLQSARVQSIATTTGLLKSVSNAVFGESQDQTASMIVRDKDPWFDSYDMTSYGLAMFLLCKVAGMENISETVIISCAIALIRGAVASTNPHGPGSSTKAGASMSAVRAWWGLAISRIGLLVMVAIKAHTARNGTEEGVLAVIYCSMLLALVETINIYQSYKYESAVDPTDKIPGTGRSLKLFYSSSRMVFRVFMLFATQVLVYVTCWICAFEHKNDAIPFSG